MSLGGHETRLQATPSTPLQAAPAPPMPLTRGTAVNKGAQGPATLPVPAEVGDGQLRQLVLDPAQEPLLGCLFLGLLVLLLVPHGHGDGVVQDQGPDEAQDQLEVPVHDGLAVCKGNEWQRWVGRADPGVPVRARTHTHMWLWGVVHVQGVRPLPGTGECGSTAGPREEAEAPVGQGGVWVGALSAQGPFGGVKEVQRPNTCRHMVTIQHNEGALLEALGPWGPRGRTGDRPRQQTGPGEAWGRAPFPKGGSGE